MQNYLRFIIRLRKIRNYPLTNIGNMDETPIWVDMPGNYTIEACGTKTVTMGTTGHEKSRITVMLAGMADGTKLKPMVLFKGVRPPKPEDIPAGLAVKMTPQAWANAEIVKHWLQVVWKRNNLTKRLLVWDAFAGHITPDVKMTVRETYNSDMAIIPGGCTSKLQPCDVSWNRPFKDTFRDLYDEWLTDGVVDLTKGGNRRGPPRPLLLTWIKQAWDAVSPDIIRKSFRVTGLALAMDGTEDDQLFAPSDDSDDDDPFERFTPGEVQAAQQLADNMQPPTTFELDSLEYSEPSETDGEEEDDDYGDPGSPGR
jgi:hypothetical protein